MARRPRQDSSSSDSVFPRKDRVFPRKDSGSSRAPRVEQQGAASKDKNKNFFADLVQLGLALSDSLQRRGSDKEGGLPLSRQTSILEGDEGAGALSPPAGRGAAEAPSPVLATGAAMSPLLNESWAGSPNGPPAEAPPAALHRAEESGLWGALEPAGDVVPVGEVDEAELVREAVVALARSEGIEEDQQAQFEAFLQDFRRTRSLTTAPPAPEAQALPWRAASLSGSPPALLPAKLTGAKGGATAVGTQKAHTPTRSGGLGLLVAF
jgi:hypothetical protein